MSEEEESTNRDMGREEKKLSRKVLLFTHMLSPHCLKTSAKNTQSCCFVKMRILVWFFKHCESAHFSFFFSKQEKCHFVIWHLSFILLFIQVFLGLEQFFLFAFMHFYKAHFLEMTLWCISLSYLLPKSKNIPTNFGSARNHSY